MSFDVPAAWVVEGQMANEEGIVAQTVEALWDGNVPLACVLDSWSFA
jgi:hypothetical protein